MILHLGVLDMPYADAPKKHQRKSGGTPNETTGDVAEILEAKYGVMEQFYKAHEQDIATSLESSIAGALENLLASKGSSLTKQILAGTSTGLAQAESEIKDKFSNFLSNKEVETLGIAGVPTQAALDGVNHRLKHPYKKRPARASFIDTGLYETSFRAWVE